MESPLKMSDAAIEANIEYYSNLRRAKAMEAIDAYAQEDKWRRVFVMKSRPDQTLSEMSTVTITSK
jgi:hypothetical protein